MKARIALVMPALILAALVARPQTPSATFNVAGPAGGAVIKDAPYSAEVVTTYDRVLPSGEHMHGETHGKVYRDSQGRTRTESDAPAPAATAQKFVFTFINDPVDHSVITLDPRTMTARVNTWPFPGAGTTAATTRQIAPVQPKPLAEQPPASGTTALGSSPHAAFAVPGAPPNAVKTEDLGAREMEGLTVTGTKVTRTLPPPVGQTEPRTMVTTTWVSPDLKIAVLTETEDAQTGHRATNLVHIVRTEPDAALFQVPTGYTVADSRPQK